ncbi:MAG: hypothetical protein WBC92_17650 [Terracidiphilus sp.]
MSYRSILALGVLLFTSVPIFAASDPFDGSWKINDAKSSWSNGEFPPNMSLGIDLQIDGNVMKYRSVNDTRKDRPGVVSHFEAAMDGKPHLFPDSTRFNEVQIRRIGPGQLEVLEMKDGDVIVGAWWWLSADGQHFVRRGVGKGPDGKSKEYEEYFDKQ